MNRYILSALLACLLFFAAPLTGDAAPAKMEVNVQVDDVDAFWNCSYYLTDKTPMKPAEIRLEWTVGDFGKPASTAIVTAKKDSGQYIITTEKGDVVNLVLYVIGNKKENISSWNLQIINKGQKETIAVAAPKTVQPEFNRL